MDNTKKWLTLPEAAKVAKVSQHTIRKWASAQSIEHARQGSAGVGNMGTILIENRVAKNLAHPCARPSKLRAPTRYYTAKAAI